MTTKRNCSVEKPGRLLKDIWRVAALPIMSFAFVVWSLSVRPAAALQALTLTDGGSSFVDISQRDLNLIRFPSAGSVKAFTKSKSIDLKIEGENVFVGVVEGETPAPQEIFFVTSRGTFSLVLVPKAVPAETVVVKTEKEDFKESVQWESSHDYITGLKDLIKDMYEGIAPSGFKSSEKVKDVTKLAGTKELLVKEYSGASLCGEIHRLTNLSGQTRKFSEKEFYSPGVLAVSIEEVEVPAMQDARVFIVRKSETQTKLERIMKSQNPLDILHQQPHR